MKPSLASTAPAWLADIFPGLIDPIDTTDYESEGRAFESLRARN